MMSNETKKRSIVVCILIFEILSISLVNCQVCKIEVVKPVGRWTPCVECSVNRYLRCPQSFQQNTTAEGLRSCWFNMPFGYLGIQRVRGCQHICSRNEKFSECCADHWGKVCQGLLSV